MSDPFGEYDEIALVAIPPDEMESTLEDARALGWQIPWPLTEEQKDEALKQGDLASAEGAARFVLVDRETMAVNVGAEGSPEIRHLRVMGKPAAGRNPDATLN